MIPRNSLNERKIEKNLIDRISREFRELNINCIANGSKVNPLTANENLTFFMVLDPEEENHARLCNTLFFDKLSSKSLQILTLNDGQQKQEPDVI